MCALFVSYCFAMLHITHAPNRARTCQEMAPRGLKAALKKPNVKLSGAGKFKGYVRVNPDGSTGRKLTGITKALDKHVFSDGSLPWGAGSRLGWKGKGGGRRRGSAVDAQLTRIVNSGAKTQAKFRLTRMAVAALKKVGLEPVVAQRAVASGSLGTAADLLCFEKKHNQPRRRRGQVRIQQACATRRRPRAARSARCARRSRRSSTPRSTATSRSSSATREMLRRDKSRRPTSSTSSGLDTELGALLLYLDDESAELFVIPDWWVRRGAKLLKVVGG